MIARRLTVLGALATSALGLLVVVPFAGAQAPAQPTCTIVSFTFPETDGGTAMHTWNLECSNPTGVAESATFHTLDATARAPDDYIPFGGTLPVPPGPSTTPILIEVVGDNTGEPEEEFDITFDDPEDVVQFRGAFGEADLVTSKITIDDDDGFAVGSIARSAPEGDVGSSVAEVEVRLSDPVDRLYGVGLFTVDVTATAGSDYEHTDRTLTFEPGEVSKLVPITIFGDLDDEPDETVFLALGIEGTGTTTSQSGLLTIVDDDGGAGPPPASCCRRRPRASAERRPRRRRAASPARSRASR